MSNYRDQSAPDRLALWERIAAESDQERAVAPSTIDPAPVVTALEREVGAREAGLARIITPRTELPARTYPERAQPDYELRKAGRVLALEVDRPVVTGRIGHSLEERAALGREAGRLEQEQRRERARLKRAKAAAWRIRHGC